MNQERPDRNVVTRGTSQVASSTRRSSANATVYELCLILNEPDPRQRRLRPVPGRPPISHRSEQ